MVSMATPYMNHENGGRPTDSNLSRGILILDYKHCIRQNQLFKSYCRLFPRLAPVLKTIFHQCVISYTCSQSYSDGSVLRNDMI